MDRANHTSQIVQVPAQCVDFKPRQDRSWKLTFETRELAGDDVRLLADTFQGEGWLVFKPNSDGIIPDEIPDADASAGVKSPAQRLRARIFILWKQQGEKGDFDSFYRTYYEKLIEFTDTKLEPKEV